jgi:hypothetical protein
MDDWILLNSRQTISVQLNNCECGSEHQSSESSGEEPCIAGKTPRFDQKVERQADVGFCAKVCAKESSFCFLQLIAGSSSTVF